MQELGKIRRVISKQIPDAPHEVFLVIDATAGQNALSQAEGFKEAAGCTGIVLAKLDGSARGGVIVPVAERFGLPVKFVGLGESADDLATFDPEAFVKCDAGRRPAAVKSPCPFYSYIRVVPVWESVRLSFVKISSVTLL